MEKIEVNRTPEVDTKYGELIFKLNKYTKYKIYISMMDDDLHIEIVDTYEEVVIFEFNFNIKFKVFYSITDDLKNFNNKESNIILSTMKFVNENLDYILRLFEFNKI